MSQPPKDAQSANIMLKHMQLSPEILTVTENTTIRLNINRNNNSHLSECSDANHRKFIFLMEQTDQQTPPLSEGQQYTFITPLNEEKTYHLLCLNYPKIMSKIEVIFKNEGKSSKEQDNEQPRVVISPLQMENLQEVQEEKQEETKEQAMENNLEHSHSRSDYAQYEKILNDQDLHYDTLPNKYLKYFKEEFKLWRDFFQYEPEKTPKEKFASQREEKLSTNSLSFSEKESQKEESVASRLHSHQEISDINEEELNRPKTMKKTNSQYCFNVDREVEKTQISSNSKKRHFNTMTSSPNQRTQQSQAETFMDWACNWSFQQGFDQIVLKKKGDRHLVNQWFTYLHNKFKITEFMFG